MAETILDLAPDQTPEGVGASAISQPTENQSLAATAKDTLNQSSANSLYDAARDTVTQALPELVRSGSADLQPHRDELLDGVPLHMQDEIMSSLTLAGARARRLRLLEDMEVGSRLAKQSGVASTTVRFATGLIDLDLPLMVATGGTLAAAKTAANTARLTRMLGGSTATARVMGDVSVGVTGGALSGAIVGGSDALVRDDRNADGMIAAVLMSAAAGGVLSPVVGKVLPDQHLWTRAAAEQEQQAIRRLSDDMHRQAADPASGYNNNRTAFDEADLSTVDMSIGAAQRLDENGQPVEIARESQIKGVLHPEDVDGVTPGLSRVQEMSERMANWRHDYRFDDLYREDTMNPWVRVLTGADTTTVRIPGTEMDVPVGQIAGKVFTFGQRDFTAMVHSRAPSANFVAAEILESASGLTRNGTSAAVLKEMFHGSSMVHSARILTDTRAAFFRNNGIKPYDVRGNAQFSRAVRLEMHDIYNGKKTIDESEFKDLIGGLDRTHKELLEHMQGRTPDQAVRGARDIQSRSGWFRYDWEPQNFLNAIKAGGREAVQRAFRDGYMRGSGFDKELAQEIANATVKRMEERGVGVGAADARILDIDNRTSIEALLRDTGMPEAKVQTLVSRMTAHAEERGKMGALKNRNEVDLHTPIAGTEMRLVDLMTDDLERSVQEYAGNAAGAAALANKGIRDRAELDTLRDTILMEQRELGELGLDNKAIDAIFSQFGGGAHKGYMFGTVNEGVNPVTSMMMKATRASLLQRLGLTQLMDTANIVVANGLAKGMEPIMNRITGNMSKQEMQNFVDELGTINVIVGQDHNIFRPHLSIDEVKMRKDGAFHMAQAGLNTVEKATNYASGQVAVMRMQQTYAAAATASRVLGGIRDGSISSRQLRDMGLREESIAEIDGLLRDGVIDLTGTLPKLDSSKWSPELREEFGASMVRSVNQQVQKGMIGETSVWMNSDIGKLLSALKTFGMIATQKQLARNLMIGGGTHTLQAAMWQMGMAYAVLSASQAIQGSQMSATDRARLAVAYSPVTGIAPMVIDPITTLLGMDDLNLSPYGRYSSLASSPVFETVEKLTKAPGAIGDIVSGSADYDDTVNARAMFFMNWYGMKRIFDAM